MSIRRLGVIGAGTMGGGIAALAASAGVPVMLLDVPGPGRRSERHGARRRRAREEVEARRVHGRRPRGADRDRQHRRRPRNASPSATWSSRRSSNSSSRSARSTSASRRFCPTHTIVASNTSGIPMSMLDGRLGVDLPVALRGHALLQSAALSAPARDHPDAGDVEARRSTRCARSAIGSSARGSSSRRTFPDSSPTGSACSAWCSRFA